MATMSLAVAPIVIGSHLKTCLLRRVFYSKPPVKACEIHRHSARGININPPKISGGNGSEELSLCSNSGNPKLVGAKYQ